MSLHLTSLQEAIVARLESFRYPSDAALPFLQTTANGRTIPVIYERQTDLIDKVNKAVNMITGCAVIVLTPFADLVDADVPEVDLRAALVIEIQENVPVNQASNGTKVSALDLVVFVMRALQGWDHGVTISGSDTSKIMLAKRPFMRLTTTPLVTYNVDAFANVNLEAELAA